MGNFQINLFNVNFLKNERKTNGRIGERNPARLDDDPRVDLAEQSNMVVAGCSSSGVTLLRQQLHKWQEPQGEEKMGGGGGGGADFIRE